jgi:hypothetical protein
LAVSSKKTRSPVDREIDDYTGYVDGREFADDDGNDDQEVGSNYSLCTWSGDSRQRNRMSS